MIKVVDKKI